MIPLSGGRRFAANRGSTPPGRRRARPRSRRPCRSAGRRSRRPAGRRRPRRARRRRRGRSGRVMRRSRRRLRHGTSRGARVGPRERVGVPRRGLRGGEHELLDQLRRALLGQRRRDVAGRGADRAGARRHRRAVADPGEHLQVVELVADREDARRAATPRPPGEVPDADRFDTPGARNSRNRGWLIVTAAVPANRLAALGAGLDSGIGSAAAAAEITFETGGGASPARSSTTSARAPSQERE